MYELVITEKPNASKRIAEALADGKPIKEDYKKVPFYKLKHKGKDIVVGCAVGHLFGLAEKKKSKGFSYPVFDIEWVPNYETSKSSAFSKKYLDALKKLCKDANSFTVATDYDIEGEVIGLNIIRYACKQKDAKRMKFSTLTKPDIIEAYESRSPTIDWGQARAGETRHFLDYYYGINLSRALTSAIKKAGMFKILSTGRVQGPALKIVADREREIQEFKPVPFWQIIMDWKKSRKNYLALHIEEKFWEKDKAEKAFKKIKGTDKAIVSNVEKAEFKHKAPHPFDLTSLQTEAYRCFSINPKKTLSYAQDLYSSGCISYPRTSSQQLPEKIGFKKVLEALGKQKNYSDFVKKLLKTALKPNNGKKTDPAHPAIYPTGIAPKKLDEKAAKIYDLIVKRFFAVFCEDAVREKLTLTFDVKGEGFISKGSRTIKPNWHLFYAPYVKLEETELPELKIKDKVDIKDILFKEDETKPPKRYTPASLIKELEKQGLGTKATRADIVDTLAKREYITGESINVTELGMETIKILEKYCEKIVDTALTRMFEDRMEEIREKNLTEEQVLVEARKILEDILKEFKSKEKQIGEELKKTFTETRAALTTVGQCPKCEGNLVIKRGKYGRFIACDKYPECETTFKLPSTGLVKVTEKTCEHCKFPMITVIRKGKRPQEVCINPDCSGKTIAEDLSGKPCPKCGKGKLVLRKSVYGQFFACDQFPKCRYVHGNGKKPAKA
ncbi:DNA topoisomerase I [Candidatus Woesearchaeota archaeon]|nr:DNA topoisomerase I [Candidatus Woesearchaeota archaeon]